MEKLLWDSLKYTVTNEHIEAIIKGLDLVPQDRVLAVGGSGDAAFAILEYAGKVIVVDYSPAQSKYIAQRANFLKEMDLEAFLRVEKFGSKDYNLGDRDAKPSLERRNRYFLENGRLNKIRSRLENLEIIEGDILGQAKLANGVTKIYLSNAIGYPSHDYTESRNILNELAQKLPQGGLIYVSNHDNLLKGGSSLQSEKTLDAYFLSPELKLDIPLTVKAQEIEKDTWVPGVYRKI